MADYREVKGLTIQTKDTDPVVNTGPDGAWASASDMNTARWITTGCAYGYTGSATLALCVGGRKPPGATYSDNNEQFNGSSWSELAEINNARDQMGGNGTTTSGLIAGGYDGAVRGYTESWNGSSWTETSDLNTVRYELGSAGATNTAAIRFSGQPSKDETETWNGSSWTEVAEVNTIMTAPAGAGTSTAALKISGENPSAPASVNVEQWNGSSWTEITNVNTARRYGVGAGDVNNALFYGGGPSITAKTERWDGSSWTEISDLGTAIQYSGGGGNNGSSAAINYGGQTPSVVGTTETFSITPSTAKTLEEGQIFLSGGQTLKGFGKAAGIPAATWASGGALNQPGRGPVCATVGVSVSSGQIAGGTPNLANTEQYDGTSWTEVNDLNEGRSAVAGTGKLTSALAAGGDSPPGTNVTSTELWDGTNWTETANLNTARRNSAASGDSTTSSLYFGGYTTTYVANTESWDGSSWTEVSDLNSARGYIGGSGSQTSAIAISGEPSPRNYVETWDGSSWTEVTEINTARAQGGSSSFGSKSFALYFGGEPPSSLANTEFWNGSSWTEVNDLSTGRSNLDGSGSAASALAVSGGPPTPQTVLTEEFDAPATLSTITVS